MRNSNDIPRPLRLPDFLVIATGFIFNLSTAINGVAEELFELSVYHANRTTKEMQAWEEMSQDLESLQEETDG